MILNISNRKTKKGPRTFCSPCMTEKQIPWGKMFSNYRWSSCDDWTLFRSWCLSQGSCYKLYIHCIIHHEVLAVKPLSSDKQRKTELESVLDIVVKTVNYIKCCGKGKSGRVF